MFSPPQKQLKTLRIVRGTCHRFDEGDNRHPRPVMVPARVVHKRRNAVNVKVENALLRYVMTSIWYQCGFSLEPMWDSFWWFINAVFAMNSTELT